MLSDKVVFFMVYGIIAAGLVASALFCGRRTDRLMYTNEDGTEAKILAAVKPSHIFLCIIFVMALEMITFLPFGYGLMDLNLVRIMILLITVTLWPNIYLSIIQEACERDFVREYGDNYQKYTTTTTSQKNFEKIANKISEEAEENRVEFFEDFPDDIDDEQQKGKIYNPCQASVKQGFCCNDIDFLNKVCYIYLKWI